MAKKNRSGEAESPLCCEVGWLRRRRELEDTPMTRAAAREAAGSSGCCVCQQGEITALLEEQNRLLYDILVSMSSLTAAQLAARRQER